jgi:hypothetical protein
MNYLSFYKEKDQNIVHAISLLIDVNACLVSLRNNGWEPLFEEVKFFVWLNIFQFQIWMRKCQDGVDQGLVGT